MIDENSFDIDYYLLRNPDVAAEVNAGRIPGAYWHFKNYGYNERRVHRKIIDNTLAEDGFTRHANKIHFYSLVERNDFMAILNRDDYREAIAMAALDCLPSVVLESF